jgi:hypothetical protein
VTHPAPPALQGGAPAPTPPDPVLPAGPALSGGRAGGRFAVVVASPPGYTHGAAFAEVADSLREGLRALGCDVATAAEPGRWVVLLGVHLLDGDPPAGAILYNLEQVGAGAFVTDRYLDRLRRHRVWDYSTANVRALAARGISAALVPVGHSPCLERILGAEEEDIDVLFYGSVNARRHAILADLVRRGVRVTCAFNCYGEERDALIARSKLVLNVHFYEPGVFEIVRVSYLLANGRAVVSEGPAEPGFEGAVAFAPRGALADRCVELLGDPAERARLGERGREVMRARPVAEYLRAVL